MMQPPHLTVVVPCFNEEAILPATSARLRQTLESLIAGHKISPASQVVFVDDGSTDHTWDMIRGYCRDNPLFSALSLSRNFGQQNAILAGLHHASGDAVVTIDADLQDDLGALETMIERFAAGFEIVYGVRRNRQTDGLLKRNTAVVFYRLLRALGVKTVHNHGDFRLLSRRAVNALLEYREVNLYLRGIVTLVGFRNCIVEYDRFPRNAGETKYPPRRMLALALSAITSFSDVPLRLITVGAFLGFLAAIGISCWVVWVRFFTDRSVPGWTSIVLPVCFIGAINLLAIGILGEYVARIFAEVKARPRFLVADGLNLPEPAIEQRRDGGARLTADRPGAGPVGSRQGRAGPDR